MEKNQSAININFSVTEKLFAFFCTAFFLSLLFSSLALPILTLRSVFVLVLIFSSAYMLSFAPSVVLLSIVAFSLPLSVIVEDKFSGFSIIFPSEVLGGVLACTMAIKFFLQKPLNKKFLTHPITVLIGGFLLFNFISVIFSELPIVSAKALFCEIHLCGCFLFYCL